ncbi:DsbA family protein [Bacillus subtilis]|uniref:DsbA family protein n=1 Tax=Pseudochrobactrum asaccharolyticum TaxID=354351 RepID=UPI001F1AEBAE|nr:DsbA family protein [Pseudochrobactrum asaccharolyticum]MCF7644879.1 DsbA family protein [Pseudochrobactrum asaccharolyticum]MCF7671693.1 DsbA family protein [Bacillus subtilis]
MTIQFKRRLAITVISAAALVSAVAVTHAQDAKPLDKAAVEKIVREYLIANPEVMLEVQDVLEAKQSASARENQTKIITENHDSIFNDANDAVYGNPKGDVTIVEFYDYNCGYCKRAMPDMHELIKADPNVRFVLKEFPILGPDSMRTHLVAQAFKRLMPEKYMELHQALMNEPKSSTEESALKIAVSLGADEAKLRDLMKSKEVVTSFQNAYTVAQALNISGTPSYIIGNELVPGAVGHDVLSEKIAEQRQLNAQKK